MDELKVIDFDNYCKGRDCKECALKIGLTNCRRLAMAYKAITKYSNGIEYVKALLELIYERPRPNWDEMDTTMEETKNDLSEWEKYCIDKAISALEDIDE